MSTSRLLFDVEETIAYVTFNRPEARNAMTREMYDELVAVCDRVEADGGIRVLVLRGAGGKAFASGTDISEFTAFRSREDGIRYEHQLDAVIDRLERVRIPTIAAIQGVATGGGCAIALACDLRVCTPESRLGIPIARTLGNCLSAATYARLVDLVGPARVKDLLFTGRLVDAAEAASLGLVTRIVESSSLAESVRELASTIASNAPLTIRATKEMIRRIQTARRIAPADADDLIVMCYTSDDFKEGVDAFLAKRRPQFKGK